MTSATRCSILRVIIEVLSESTETYDRGEKAKHYKRISSLQEYVLVSHTRSVCRPHGSPRGRFLEGDRVCQHGCHAGVYVRAREGGRLRSIAASSSRNRSCDRKRTPPERHQDTKEARRKPIFFVLLSCLRCLRGSLSLLNLPRKMPLRS